MSHSFEEARGDYESTISPPVAPSQMGNRVKEVRLHTRNIKESLKINIICLNVWINNEFKCLGVKQFKYKNKDWDYWL